MMRPDAAGGIGTCPDVDDLQAFARGRLPLALLEAVAEHVAACAGCESTLRRWQDSDTVLGHLRRGPERVAWLEEPACLELEARARAIPREQSGTPTVSDKPTDAREELSLPAVFGPYVLLDRLGRGGMGVVYKARQEPLKRLVAVKVVLAGAHAGPEERARFRREGEAIARLSHPGIVQIHHFDTHEGQPYFSMELLEGGSLAGRLTGGPMPEREAAALVEMLARAMHYAHEQGIIHRDLKPANVLLAADGTPRITDFGLAKLTDAEGQTRTEAVLGTPAYMAPEQARGESRTIGPAADIHALGAILYEALTGRPPFRGVTKTATLEQVRTREPKPPSRLRRGLARDLEAICLKCLEKEPARRYASAEELAEDLRRWLDGLSTHAQPLRWYHRLWRIGRRHKGPTATACLLALAGSLIWATVYWRDPERKIEAIEARLRRGEAVTLIGDRGPPPWSLWTLRRQGGVIRSPRGDEAFALASLDPAVLTLVRDPQRGYRFRAEVRHDDFGQLGQVGICFAHSRRLTTHGTQHCYCTLCFNDFEATDPDPKTGGKASLATWRLWRSEEGGRNIPISLGLDYFQPAAVTSPGEYPWRKLEVEARDEGIRVSWEGKPLASLTHQQILDAFNGSLRKDPVSGALVPFSPALQPDFSPRDALGLYVANGKASFQHVEVQPLP